MQSVLRFALLRKSLVPPLMVAGLIGPPALGQKSTTRVGEFQSVQVNVDTKNQNILGDAANGPSIAVDPSNGARMSIGWRQFDDVTSDYCQAGVAFSTDGGQTWHKSGPLTPGQFRTDPVLRSDSRGRFFFNSAHPNSHTCTDLFRSDDGGRSWVGPVDSIGGDRPWFTLRAQDGADDAMFSIWTSNVDDCNGTDTREAARSFDGGATWETTQGGVDGYRSTITTGPDGTVYCTGRRGSSAMLEVARSLQFHDPDVAVEGFQWLDDFPNFGNVTGFANFRGSDGRSWICVNESATAHFGEVYVLASVFFPNPAYDREDVFFSRSTDSGLTWSTPVRVNDDPPAGAYQWFGMMDVSPTGRIDAVWNDTRRTPTGEERPTQSELYYSFSTDGGQTWSTNQPLSSQFDHTLGYPGEDWKLGDYYDLHSDALGVDVAYAATFNGEQDIYYLRIGPRDCNRNSIPDDQEVAGGAPDCNNNLVPDACEPDCNGNGVSEACDLATGQFPDCNANGVPDSCETDCNGNGLPDECDIAVGATDLNGNRVPDSCEPDCNANDRPDDMDLADGTSSDCDGHGVPDECERDCNSNQIPDGCEYGTFRIVLNSPVLGPIPPGGSASFDFGMQPPAVENRGVEVRFEATGDLDQANEGLGVLVNTGNLGMLFAGSLNDCETGAESETAPSHWFNDSIDNHPLVVTALRYDGDQVEDCPPGTFVQIRIDYARAASAVDDNDNLIPDGCEVQGDLNCNGVVNVSDIGGFILALTDRFRYEAGYRACDPLLADLNGDGAVTVSDIGPFVSAILGAD